MGRHCAGFDYRLLFSMRIRLLTAADVRRVSDLFTYNLSAPGDLCIEADIPSNSVTPESPSSVRPPCRQASRVTWGCQARQASVPPERDAGYSLE